MHAFISSVHEISYISINFRRQMLKCWIKSVVAIDFHSHLLKMSESVTKLLLICYLRFVSFSLSWNQGYMIVKQLNPCKYTWINLVQNRMKWTSFESLDTMVYILLSIIVINFEMKNCIKELINIWHLLMWFQFPIV